ncbi:MAG: peptide chain release factor N(5)-glutamine methyltransferase [Ignavibacteriaceae bacterium]
MLTVLESIKLSTDYLQKKGIESPRINAELLLANILNCKRLDLYLKFDQPLKEEEINMYREFISRRGKFEPLQYITGSVEFFGLEFKVNSSVLIPRPETEILVEAIIDSAGKEENVDILDIGTGSGNIAVSVAKNLPNSKISAIDISSDALLVAEKNAKLNSVEGRIDFMNDSILNGVIYAAKKYDIVVSNPPYISVEEFGNLQPELKVYEPRTALTDEGDGFSFFRIISSKTKNLLKDKGKLFFEVGKDQYKQVENILLENGFRNINIKRDYLNIERVIYGEFEPETHPPLEEN